MPNTLPTTNESNNAFTMMQIATPKILPAAIGPNNLAHLGINILIVFFNSIQQLLHFLKLQGFGRQKNQLR